MQTHLARPGHWAVVALVVGLVAALTAPAHAQSHGGEPEDDARTERLEKVLLEYKDEVDIPGVNARVLIPGDLDWSASRGRADTARAAPMTSATRTRVGSVTKQFTAVTILQLLEEGRLSLDDTLSTWFPDYPRAGEVTVRMLLQHRSGIPEVQLQDLLLILTIVFDQSRWWSPEDLVAWTHGPIPMISMFDRKPIPRDYVFDPGAGFHYSQPGYFFLGMIAERITGNSLAEEFRTRIIEPLGMEDTLLPGPWDPTPLLGYTNAFGLLPLRLPTTAILRSENSFSSVSWSAGGLISTADDINRFLRGLIGGELLRPETFSLMTETQSGFEDIGGYGMGISHAVRDGYQTWGHGGGVPGFHATNAYVVECDAYVSLTANSDGAWGEETRGFVDRVVEALGCASTDTGGG